MKHFVIVYVSAVQSHFWRIWKLVFNVLFVAPCIRANIFVTEKLSQKICSQVPLHVSLSQAWLAFFIQVLHTFLLSMSRIGVVDFVERS